MGVRPGVGPTAGRRAAAPARYLTQINVALASNCFPVIATVLVARGRCFIMVLLKPLKAARLGGLFLASRRLAGAGLYRKRA